MEKKLFPDYLVFGKLNKESVTFDGKYHIAKYELFGNVISEIRVEENGRTEYREFDNGRELGFSVDKDMKMCVMMHYTHNPIKDHPTMEKIRKYVCRTPKFYYSLHAEPTPKIPVPVYFPAGSLHTIRLPIVGDNSDNFNNYLNNESFYLRLTNYYRTRLTVFGKHLYRGGKHFDINIAEFTCPLAFIPESVDQLLEHDLVCMEDDALRAVIHDSMLTTIHHTEIFEGEEKDSFVVYFLKYLRTKHESKSQI